VISKPELRSKILDASLPYIQSSMGINGHQWASMGINGHQWAAIARLLNKHQETSNLKHRGCDER